MGRRRVDGLASEKRLAEIADEHLRSAPWFVATESRRGEPPPELSRTRRNVDSVRARNGLHAHRAFTDRGTSVRGFVGLSGHKLLCADESLRKSRRAAPF